jgi:hypothetical protein
VRQPRWSHPSAACCTSATRARASSTVLRQRRDGSFRTLESADSIVYGMGSLYTSTCPSLILVGVGEAVALLGPA